MIKHLIVLMLVISGLFPAKAQRPEGHPEDFFPGQIFLTENAMLSSLSVVEQQGSGNSIISTQEQQGQTVNIVVVQQSGNANNGYIRQTGSDLSSRLLQQGHNNEARLWSEGGPVDVNAMQTGSDNVILSYLKNPGIFEKQAVLLQEGNNNRIEVALFGNAAPTAEQLVTITQQGNGFEAKALLESFNLPIIIIQKAGPGGGEMKVDVSTSDFSFPMR